MSIAPFVRVNGLSRVFDVSKPWLNRVLAAEGRKLLKAVQDVSFEIARGETFALVGESGSGKSTVARMVVGLLKPSAGAVVIDGVDMNALARPDDLARLRRRIQMIFQDPFASLNPRWRVSRIVAEPLHAFGLVTSQREAKPRVGALLAQVGLDPADATKYPHAFSGGQRQRICIARALASGPEFIVCDEPTSALDVSVQAQILNLLRDLQETSGLTYLFISHNLAVVRHMASRIGVMYLGRIVEIAATEALFERPRHPYTRMLLDAVPDLEPPTARAKMVEGEIPSPIDPPQGCPFHPRCPMVTDRCRTELPLPRDVAGHLVACHEAERVGV